MPSRNRKEKKPTLDSDVLNDHTPIDHTFSLAFPFLHDIYKRGQDKVKRSHFIAQFSSMKPIFITIDNVGLTMFNDSKKMNFISLLTVNTRNLSKRK